MNRWVCQRCFESNDDSAAACVKCGLLRGSMPPAEPNAAAGSPGSPALPARSIMGGLLRRFGWVAVAGAFVVGGAIFAAQRNDAGEITQGGTLAVGDLRIGDCFDPKDIDAEEADEVDARRCDESHQFELMAIGAMPDGGYPTDDEFETFVGNLCLPAFDDYVGMAYEESRFDVFWYFPLEEGWAAGDHVIQCAVYDPLNSELTASLRGAAR